jgi:hypothetical protein
MVHKQMSTLHIEPEELRTVSRLLERSVMQLLDAERQLQQAAANLDIAWQGGHSHEMISELQTLKRVLHERIDELNTQTLRLLRTADLWDELDQHWQNEYDRVISSFLKSGE